MVAHEEDHESSDVVVGTGTAHSNASDPPQPALIVAPLPQKAGAFVFAARENPRKLAHQLDTQPPCSDMSRIAWMVD
jgi:hypothetical protein